MCVSAGRPFVSGKTDVRHIRGATVHSIESNNTDKLPWTAIRPCNIKEHEHIYALLII
jgi:hypothetical protein